jgi:hypothetical protein
VNFVTASTSDGFAGKNEPLMPEDPLLERLTGCIESVLEGLVAWDCKAFQLRSNSMQKFAFKGDQNMSDINRRKASMTSEASSLAHRQLEANQLQRSSK